LLLIPVTVADRTFLFCDTASAPAIPADIPTKKAGFGSAEIYERAKELGAAELIQTMDKGQR
jgi:hypothetical protein